MSSTIYWEIKSFQSKKSDNRHYRVQDYQELNTPTIRPRSNQQLSSQLALY